MVGLEKPLDVGEVIWCTFWKHDLFPLVSHSPDARREQVRPRIGRAQTRLLSNTRIKPPRQFEARPPGALIHSRKSRSAATTIPGVNTAMTTSPIAPTANGGHLGIYPIPSKSTEEI